MTNTSDARVELLAVLDHPVHAAMATHHPGTGECLQCPIPLHESDPGDIADELIAAGFHRESEALDAIDRVRLVLVDEQETIPGGPSRLVQDILAALGGVGDEDVVLGIRVSDIDARKYLEGDPRINKIGETQ